MTLAGMLGLSEEEGRKAVPAAAFQVCFVAAVAVLKSTAAALVVGRASAAQLPLLYIASAFATATAAGLLPSRGARAPAREMAAWAFAIWALTGLVAGGFTPAVLLLYLCGDAFATLNQVRFWARAGELFDMRASRRLFAAFAGASMVGSVGGGLAVQHLSGPLGVVPLAAASGLLALGCWPLGAWMDEGPRRDRGAANRSGVPWRVLGSDKLIVATAVFVGLSSVLTVAVDFLFRARAGEVLDERQLSALFGAINVWMGLLSAAFQLVLARRLLERLGLFHFLGIVPLCCMVLAMLGVATDQLWPVVALKVVEAAGSLSLTPLAVQLLYGPLPDGRRAPARAAIDGLVKKGGLGLGGLVLLLAGARVGPYLPLLAVAAAGGLVALLARLQRVYVDELGDRLARAHWGAEIALDAQGRRILRAGLASPRPGVVLTSLRLLAEAPGELGPESLGPLLGHPEERVQERALALAGQTGAVPLLPVVRRLTRSEKRRVREEAVRALALLAPHTRAEDVAPFLEHEDPGTRGAALAALWDHPPLRARAEAALAALGREGAGPAERRELAHALGRLDRASAWAPLSRLLDDPDPSVRRIAYASAARLGIAEWAPLLLECLGRRADRAGARAALAALGDRAVPELERALNDRGLPPLLRMELPRVLRDVGTTAAANALLHSNIKDAAALHHRIGVALSAMRRKDPHLAMDVEWVREAIGRRLDAYEAYAPVLADLRARLGPERLLVRAVADRCDQALEVAFRLLALLAPHDQVMDAHHRLKAGGPAERSFAAELVENLLPSRSLRRRFSAAVDGYHRHAPPGRAEAFEDRLQALLHAEDPVLRACAKRAARDLGAQVKLPSYEKADEMSEQVVETMFLLEGVELFGTSGVDEIAALAAIAREQRVAAGQAVFKLGDPGDRFFVIVSGTVRVEREGQVFFRLSAKESFGEVSLLDGAPRPADVVAETDCHLLAIDRHEFLDLVSDRPELLQGVLAQLAHHLRLILEGPGGAKVTLKRPVTAA